MKNLNYLNKYRAPCIRGYMGDGHNGAFKIPIGKQEFFIIASNGDSWDHVSVSPVTIERCPKWSEMCEIKSLFFSDDDVVMQIHPAKEDNISISEYCLHLWRPQKEKIPLPPKYMV